MVEKESAQKRARDYGLPDYFDLQSRIGHSKHLGGVAVSRELAEYCHLGPGKIVLNVGSGAGISAAYLVDETGCRMVGVDILPGMVESACQWAQEQGLTGRLTFEIGKAQELPFADDCFDAVICESVNVFVPDKRKAMSEYVRVVKPGGYIGLTEAIWTKEPSPKVAEIIMEATGQTFLPSEVWEDLLGEAGLVDLVFKRHNMTLREEARNQWGLLSLGSYLRIAARSVWALVTNREDRSLIKYLASNPNQYFDYMGYGLYVGRVPE